MPLISRRCADGAIGPTDIDSCWPQWEALMYLPPDLWWVDEYQIGSQVSDDWWDGNPATPTPTETPAPFSGQGQANPVQAPTLVNVTLDPNRIGGIETTPAPAGDTAPLMAAALAVMLIGGLGLLVVLALWLRTRRR